MYKQILIIAIVIALVVWLDVITNNYTKTAVEQLNLKLGELKEAILNENSQEMDIKIKEVQHLWEEKYNILAYYIEHDELEKVETELTRLAADIQTKEYKQCINELDATKFILNHIKQKEELDIKSVF